MDPLSFQDPVFAHNTDPEMEASPAVVYRQYTAHHGAHGNGQ
jgi:hypothetical protein